MKNRTKRTFRKAVKKSNVLPHVIDILGVGIADAAVMIIKGRVSIMLDDCITKRGLRAFQESDDR